MCFFLVTDCGSGTECNWSVTAGDVCGRVGEWWNLTKVHSAGGTRLNQFYTLPLCLSACRDLLDNCVGVDVDASLHDEIRCWIHTDVTDFDDVYHADGLTQYRMVTSCTQPGDRQAEVLALETCSRSRGQLAAVSVVVSSYYAPAPRAGALSNDARLTSVCRVHWA